MSEWGPSTAHAICFAPDALQLATHTQRAEVGTVLACASPVLQHGKTRRREIRGVSLCWSYACAARAHQRQILECRQLAVTSATSRMPRCTSIAERCVVVVVVVVRDRHPCVDMGFRQDLAPVSSTAPPGRLQRACTPGPATIVRMPIEGAGHPRGTYLGGGQRSGLKRLGVGSLPIMLLQTRPRWC